MGTRSLAVAVLAASALATSALTAQMPWTANLPPHGGALDLLRPKLRGGGTSLTSLAAYASARLPLGPRTTLRFELPVATVSTDLSSSTSLGNPYLGLEFGDTTGLVLDAGFRGPLASESEFAAELGALSDITRFEAFVPNTVTFAARARYRFQDPGGSGFQFEAGGGPSFFISTKGGADPDMVLHHHMAAGYRGPNLWWAVAFAGWTLITEDAGGVGERTLNEVGASVGLTRGTARPALHLIVPLDDGYNEEVGIVLGIGIAFTVH
ncbi:MAG: hypothetical protein ACREME_13190 [Gemmatimonadales bacterium]